MKQKVLFVGDTNTELPEYRRFSEKYECIQYQLPATRAQVVADFQSTYKDVVAIYGAWLGFVPLGGYNNELVENTPPGCKVISICSVGSDNYDGAQLRQRNVHLTNVPSDGAKEAVADLVLWNAIASFRQFAATVANFTPEYNHTVQTRALLSSGHWDLAQGRARLGSASGYSFGHTVLGRTCANPRGHRAVIVGFGSIGRTIGQRLASVGMEVHYVKRTPLSASEAAQLGYEATYHPTVAATCAFADLLVVACPGTPETHHMINAELLDKFANPLRVINIGRGPVIDEQALVDALKSGKVVFAGLDVFEDEPKVHPELFGRQDVVLTPHVGASTGENFDHTAKMAMANIEAVLEGKDPLTPVN